MTGGAAERAAGSIMADLQGVGAPEELSDLAQQTSTRLAVPLENRKGSAPPLITELRKRLDTFCVAQTEEQFFYAMGGFTYDLNLPTWPFFAVAWAGDVSAVILIAVRTWRLIFHPEKLSSEPIAKAVE